MPAINFPNSPVNDEIYVVNNISYIYNSTTNAWSFLPQPVASAFTDLTDTPEVYVDQAGKAVLVNDTEDGLIFSDVSTTPPGGGGFGGVVSTSTSLPTDASAGTLIYTSDTNKMYAYNGATWVLIFTATTPNNAPYFITGPDASYLLATNGSPTVITMAAQDPEGVALNWSYTITEGSLTNNGGTTATIVQDDNVLTITPTTTAAYQGQFTITITISDGVNLANRTTKVRLVFNVQNYSYGAVYVEDVAPNTADHGTPDDPYWGQQISAHAGQLAVSAQTTNGGTYGISVYNTVVTPAQKIAYIDGTDSTVINGLGQYVLEMHGDVIVASSDLGIQIIANVDGVWGIIETWAANIFPQMLNPQTARAKFSDDGTVLVVSSGLSSTGAIDNQVVGDNTFYRLGEAYIFTRPNSTSTNFTLVQSIDFNAITKSFQPDNFPTNIGVSPSGKHITFTGSNTATNDDGIIVYTNEDLANSNVWSNTHTATITGGSRALAVGYTATDFGASDNNFYLWAGFSSTLNNTIDTHASLFHYKYSDASNAWTRYEYDPAISTKIRQAISPSECSSTKAFNVQENGVSNGEITFLFTSIGKSTLSNDYRTYLITARGWYKDLEGKTASQTGFFQGDRTPLNPAAGSLKQAVYKHSTGITYHLITKADTSNSTDVNPVAQLTLDKVTGEIFVSNPEWEPSAANVFTGIIKRFKCARTTSAASAFGPFKVYGESSTYAVSGISSFGGAYDPTNTSYHSIITIPEGVFEFSGVMVGPGGSLMQAKTNGTVSTAGGGGGGGLVWWNNYPVTPGDTVTLFLAPPTGVNTTPMNSSIYLNGNLLFRAGGGGNYTMTQIAGGGGGAGLSDSNARPTNWQLNTDYAVFSGGNGGNGSSSSTITYGGGSGSAAVVNTGAGAGGAVRIIWGPNRAFPSSSTGNQ